jgi:hypothetical protein
MSIAWTTVVIVLLLLPGFVFFHGLFTPEKFSRDMRPTTPVEQLATALLIAVIVHAAANLLVGAASGLFGTPPINYRLLLISLQLQGSGLEELRQLSVNLSEHRYYILGYLGFTTLLGWLLGLGWGKLNVVGPDTVSRPLRGVARLILRDSLGLGLVRGLEQGFVVAHVLTHLHHDGKYVLYSGALSEFRLDQDGKISFVALEGAARSYLVLDDLPATTPRVAIGPGQTGPEHALASHLLIEGPDIANVVFDRYDFRGVEPPRGR